MTTSNHRIAVKTCQNFKHNHFARLVHCCDEVLKDYRLMSIDVVTGKDIKANRWVARYGNASSKKIVYAETPEQMLEDTDAIIFFGRDALIDRLESMAVSKKIKVFKFTLY